MLLGDEVGTCFHWIQWILLINTTQIAKWSYMPGGLTCQVVLQDRFIIIENDHLGYLRVVLYARWSCQVVLPDGL